MHNPTMMIKAKFSNLVHKIVNPCYSIKKYSSEYWECQRKQNQLTEKEKAEKFDQIMSIYRECSNELTDYFFDRSIKKSIAKERAARGWVSKKKSKMSFDEYQKMKAFESKKSA